MMQEANTMEAGVASPDVTKAVANISTTSYWTEGELIPLKGKWWKVRLLEIDGERIIGLVMLKDTASALKWVERKQRWQQQHPKAVSPRA